LAANFRIAPGGYTWNITVGSRNLRNKMEWVRTSVNDSQIVSGYLQNLLWSNCNRVPQATF